MPVASLDATRDPLAEYNSARTSRLFPPTSISDCQGVICNDMMVRILEVNRQASTSFRVSIIPKENTLPSLSKASGCAASIVSPMSSTRYESRPLIMLMSSSLLALFGMFEPSLN